jgi:hypothetical protein
MAVIALAVVAFLYLPAVGHPSGSTLNYSLSREVGTTEPAGACHRASSDTWLCKIWDSEESGTVTYTLVTRGRRCWTARQVRATAGGAEGESLATEAAACVRARDQLRPLWRLIY